MKVVYKEIYPKPTNQHTNCVSKLVRSVKALFCSSNCSAASVSLLDPSPPAFFDCNIINTGIYMSYDLI